MTTVAEQISEHARTCPAAGALERIETGIAGLGTKLDTLNGKLFVGNGVPAWSVRLDRLEQQSLRRDRWAQAAIAAALLAIATVCAEKIWPDKSPVTTPPPQHQAAQPR